MGYRQQLLKLSNVVRFAMTKFGDDYVLPTNVTLDDLSFSCQWIHSLLNRAIFKTIAGLESYKFSSMQQVLCIHGGNTNCVMFLLKQLSLSLLKTHLGYVLTMCYDCFILLSWVYGRMMEVPSFIKGPDKQESSVQVSRSKILMNVLLMHSNHSTLIIYAIWFKFSILKFLSRRKSSYLNSGGARNLVQGGQN